MLKKFKKSLVLLSFVLPTFGNAQIYGGNQGEVTFTSGSPTGVFEGKASKFKGSIDFTQNILKFEVDLNSIDSGVSLRDRHIKEKYLKTNQFPKAIFVGSFNSVDKIDLDLYESQKVTVRGTLTIHGVGKETVIEGELNPSNEGLQVKSSWKVNIKDFKMDSVFLVPDTKNLQLKMLLEEDKE